jgi:hypothetical protein
VPGARGAWAPNATSHRDRCLGLTLSETQVGQYLAVSRSPRHTEAQVSFPSEWIGLPGGEVLPTRASSEGGGVAMRFAIPSSSF